MDKRLAAINSQLSEFSKGKFDKKIRLSSSLDEVDAIASGINMLGEELNAITISKTYFTNIFNAVSDMVFIVNATGIIVDANEAAARMTGLATAALQEIKFNQLFPAESPLFSQIKKYLKAQEAVVIESAVMTAAPNSSIPVKIIATNFKDHRQRPLVIVTASDITYQIKTNNLIVRAMIDAEERERNRLAKDLHDTLTQQLSAIKFYIGGAPELTADAELRNILGKANAAMTEVITEMRNISFYLMPKTLEAFGLVRAVKEFCSHFLSHAKTKFTITQESPLPALSSPLKIDLYRIIQEFINNAVRHGDATNIDIRFRCAGRILTVLLTDNGRGFDAAAHQNGMGLQNVRSRVKSHNGEIMIGRRRAGGVYYRIKILIL